MKNVSKTLQSLKIGLPFLAFAFVIGACANNSPITVTETKADPKAVAQSQADQGALSAAINSSLRIDAHRDNFRHPLDTLLFFGVKPSDKVVEIWPSGGWYTAIIAPYLKGGNGEYIAALSHSNSPSERLTQSINTYKAKFTQSPESYGKVSVTYFGAASGELAPAGSVDKVLSFRNVHNWMGAGFQDKAFADFYAALKPGGYLGIVEHRASNNAPQDPKAANGYVREDAVIAMAQKAGFQYVGKSEINANAKDTKDHPFGVWTLPPVLRTAGNGQPANPAFDNAKYREIGESDRMTILFMKPN